MGPMFQNLEFLFDMAFLKIPLEISCLWLFLNRFGLAVVSEKKIVKGKQNGPRSYNILKLFFIFKYNLYTGFSIVIPRKKTV